MIYLSAKDMSIGEYFNKLKIVPISFLRDSNDVSKANELSIIVAMATT